MKLPKASWLKSPTSVTGQDALGTKYPSEDIYAGLLPGITNVTDRCRYYTFYPWLIWAFEKYQGQLKTKPLHEIIRRADCLFSLIALYHNHQSESENLVHGGLTGSRKLSAVMNEFLQSKEPIVISKYSNRSDTANRYFQNKFGGLGQYYLGPLKDALILANNEKGEICYTDQRGKFFAEAFDSGVNRELFFNVLERDRVTIGDLEELEEFCSCRISSNKLEQEVLANFLFNGSEDFNDEEANNRRLSLTLFLDFIENLQYTNVQVTADISGINYFLESAYTAVLSNGEHWEITDENLLSIQTYWRQYYANELLSFAIQSVFWAGLKKLESVAIWLPNSNAYGKWFADSFAENIEYDFSESIENTTNFLKSIQPSVENIFDENHEIKILRKLAETIKKNDSEKTINLTINLSIKLLLAIGLRWKSKDWQKQFTLHLPAAYQKSYPVTVHSFIHKMETEWKTKNLYEWLQILASEWSIEIHLQAALRKLRYESSEKLRLVDTFKILPTERGLEIIEIPTPGFTNPRIKQSFQILLDLGALKTSFEGNLELTDFGENLLETNRNG